ncbi:MAG: DNA-binding protein WhiA [Clostridia bacterium]|nr:DNA-binding protein WhiA [Clostridia bacterium]
MKSFSSLVKEEISTLNTKQKLCCYFSLLYGMMCFSSELDGKKVAISTNVENVKLFSEICDFINRKKKFEHYINGRKMSVASGIIKYSTIAEIKASVFKCQHCKENFLKGIFLLHGSVSDPKKMYRLDLSFNTFEQANQMFELLNSCGLGFKQTMRGKKYVLYTKDSDIIGDFFALIGANNSVYVIINSKIQRELRNEVNRVTNCDSANINKMVNASQKYCEVIEKIIEENLFEELPDNLKEMAKLRLEFNNLNFADLGKKFNPAISKSGVYHRLEKIIAFYDKAKEIKD